MLSRSGLVCIGLILGGLVARPLTAQVTPPPQRQLTPVQTATKQLQDAEAVLKKAEAALAKVHDKVKAQYLVKPEWAPVVAELNKAETDVKNAHRTILSNVHAKPEYVALGQKKEDAEKVQRQAQLGAKPGSDDVKVSDEDLAAAYQASMKASVEMKSMEKQAVDNDQSYLDAMARVDGAKAKLAQLDAQIDESLKNDQEYLTLKGNVDQAQTQVDAAKQALVTARQQPSQPNTGQPRPPRPK